MKRGHIPFLGVLFRPFTEGAETEMKNSERAVSWPRPESGIYRMPVNSVRSLLCPITVAPLFCETQLINPPKTKNVAAKLVFFDDNVSVVACVHRNQPAFVIFRNSAEIAHSVYIS
jgi:hypothetical protein